MGLALGRFAVLLAPLALAAAALLAIPADEARADSGHPGYYPLHCAAGIDGDLAAVIHLLGRAHRIDVNAGDLVNYSCGGGGQFGRRHTPLHWAARYGHADIAATLIAAGADLEAKSHFGGGLQTPLHWAAEYGHADIAAALIAAGAEVNPKANDGHTPLRETWHAQGNRFRSGGAAVASTLIAAGGHWGLACAGPLSVNPAGPTPPCLCESPNVGTVNNCQPPNPDVEVCGGLTPPKFYNATAGECEPFKPCAGGTLDRETNTCECPAPAVLNGAGNNCECLWPNVGRPAACAAPSVESCGRRAWFYDATAGECVPFAYCVSGATLNRDMNLCECAGAAVLDGTGTGCLCESPNLGTPDACAAPSVESCGGLTPSEFYDATAGECAAFRECHTGATLNRDANLCECAGAAALDPAGTGCLCESPNLGTPTDCQAPSESVCAGLTPPEFFDETRVSITAGECVPFKPCAGGTLDQKTNTCEFSAESCGSLTPPLFYDSNTEKCGDRLYPCHDSAVRKDDNSGCECPPERPFAHGDPSAGVWRYRSGRCLEYRFGRCRRYGEGQWHQSIPTSAECLADHAPIAHDLGGWLSAIQANNPTLVAHFIAEHNQHPLYSDGGRALHRAAENDSHLAAIALIEGGANVDLNHGVTPLHVAIHNGAARVASVLLSANANPDAANSRGDAPLHLAAKRGDAAENALLVSLLLAGGANPDLKNSDGDTPLHSATRAGLARMISILLAADANPNLPNNNRWHPLDLAYHGGTIAAGKVFAPEPRRLLMAALVAGGGGLADANRRNNDDETPLHLETQAGREEFVLWLLERGANPDLANAQVETPLHLAARDSAFGIVKHLLDHEANPDATDFDGDTALHESVRLSDAAENVALVSLLLDKGADPNIRNGDGWRPLDLAYDNGGRRDARLARRMMMAALIAGGADWASECTGGKIPNEHYRPPEVSDCRCPNHLAVDNNGVCECPAETHAQVNGRCLGKGSAQLDEEIEIVRAELAELRAALVSLNLRLSLAAEADGPQEELEEVAALAAEAARGIARRRDVFRALGRMDLVGAAPVVGLSDTAATCRMLGGDVEGDARVCSGIDFNDTFCLIDSDAALSCVGLFRHVRRCNDDFNRPALDPWHCAARCPSGLRARGARCASD